MNCTVWINRGQPQIIELKFLDEVNGQKRYQGAIVPYVLVRLDQWESFTSLAVYNAFDHEGAGHIAHFKIDYLGSVTEFENFRYLCGFRKTWGERPKISNNHEELIGYEPQPADLTWDDPAPLTPMQYGKMFDIGYTTTGARPMLGVRECNWVQDNYMRVRYANQGLCLPFHAFEPVAPYDAIIRDNYQMGHNFFSPKGFKNITLGQLGMKVDVAHMSSQFLRAALIEQDRIFVDETIYMGNYATMWNNGLGTSQVRATGRGLSCALFGWYFSRNPNLEKKIIEALGRLEAKKDNLVGISYGRTKESDGTYTMPQWMWAFIVYALWQAEKFGFNQGSGYLMNYLSWQLKIGRTSMYALPLTNNTIRVEDDPGVPINNAAGREEYCRVMHFVMKEKGLPSPWEGIPLLENQGLYPIRNNLDFKLLPPRINSTDRPKNFDELVDRFLALEARVEKLGSA